MQKISSTGEPWFADLVLPLAIPKTLTYQVPSALIPDLQIGSRVIVGLGKQKIITGIVSKLHTITPTYATKEIIDLLDPEPIITRLQWRFLQWLGEYYMCTPGEVIKTALPSSLKVTGQSKVYLYAGWDGAITNFSKQEEVIVAALEQQQPLSYAQIEALSGKRTVYRLLKRLADKQVIIIVEELKDKYLPKTEKQVSLHPQYSQQQEVLKGLLQDLEKKPKQLDALLQYMAMKSSQQCKTPWVGKKELLAHDVASHALQSLLKQRILIERTVVVSRLLSRKTATLPDIVLSDLQTQALVDIRRWFERKDTVLLHGVTGSGKTELYVHLIQEVLQGEGQVLFLLPAIGLTTQIVQRLKDRLGDVMEVYHSKYSNHERVEIWNKVLRQEVRVVIGVRSAVLLPFHNLQLIIVDEEHEAAYKQFDSVPRYHARDAALMLASYHKAKVLLGSATPAIDTYHHAKEGKYGLVRLETRFSTASLPQIQVVNLRIEQKRKRLQGEFTVPLIEALEETLKNNQQAIIFQNRRGYATHLFCASCAWIATCQQCSVSLTYHQWQDYLVCHYCGYHQDMPAACTACGATKLQQMGYGTEKVTETLQQCFPNKRIDRMDADSTRKKNSYQQIIHHLENRNTHILVGTQMITKGLDFGNVSLVGVLDIDRALYFPDFRANERSFQLLTQVAGRAGRREIQGRVMIQTLNPTHPVLQDVITGDYVRMYEREVLERQKYGYPPYTRLIKITCRHVYEQVAHKAAYALAQELQQKIPVAHILGPQAPLIAKVKHFYRVDIWIKLSKDKQAALWHVKAKLQEAALNVRGEKDWRQVQMSFDVDPV